MKNLLPLLLTVCLSACGGDMGGRIAGPLESDSTREQRERPPRPPPEMAFVSVEISHPTRMTVARVTISNDGSTGYYLLEFFVDVVVGDSMIRQTPPRMVPTGGADAVYWLVGHEILEVIRIDAYQKLVEGEWALADVYPDSPTD